MAVDNLLLIDLIQRVRQELKMLCYGLNVKRTMPNASTSICSQIEGAEPHNSKVSKTPQTKELQTLQILPKEAPLKSQTPS